MARLAIGAVLGIAAGVLLGAALGIHAAGTEPDEETVAAAQEAGVDPIDLLGAVNTTGLDPRSYLIAVGELAAPVAPPPPAAPASAAHQVRVRLTHYVEYGVTYGGGRPYAGSTACSWNFALGTRFRLPDGEVFTCNDRGLLGSTGWLDLWRRPDLSGRFGPYALVTVLP